MSNALTFELVQLPPLAALRSCFNDQTWVRGERYARQGAVQDPGLLRLGTRAVIQGEVQGRALEPYFVEITVKDWPSRLNVTTECTCPVQSRCKHAVALLVNVLQAKQATAPANPVAARTNALNHWLDQAEMAMQTPTAKPGMPGDPASRHVIVLSSVSSASGTGRWLALWPGQARALKSKPGALGKVSLARAPYAGSALSPFDGQGEAFEQMVHWHTGRVHSRRVSHLPSRHASDLPAHAVAEESGVALMKRLALAGDLVLLDGDRYIERTLSWGPAQSLSWVWEELERDVAGEVLWMPSPRLPTPTAQLYFGSPMVYLDPQAGLCGIVESPDLTADDVARLQNMPALPESWMREHASRLSRVLPHLPETVRESAPRKICGVTPTAHLSVTSHPDRKRALLQLVLSFGYEDARGQWAAASDAVQRVDTPRGTADVWREFSAEERLRDGLRNQGFVEAHDAAGVWAARSQFPRMGTSVHQRDLDLLDSDFACFREAGWHIDIDPALCERFRHAEELTLSMVGGDDQGGGWFDLSLGFSVGGRKVNLLPWLPALIERMSGWRTAAAQGDAWPAHTWLTHDESGESWRVPVAPLRPWLDALVELSQERGALDGETLRLDRFEALRLATVDAPRGEALTLNLSKRDHRSLAGLIGMLRQNDKSSAARIPSGLGAELRPYQQQGLGWMQLLRAHRLGGVLADDMGLGKTLQTIAHLLAEKQARRLKRPALVVAPTSLVGNWQSELHRFAPGLSPLVLHGSQRRHRFKRIADHDVIITTYPLLLRDEQVLAAQEWSIVVLDEAQTIKNARSRAASIVQTLRSDQRLCLTGTPMENHLGEVWSLFHFLMPGYLGSETRFKQIFRTPIEKSGDADRLALLRTRLSPFMLRRTKAAVADELPPKIESVEHIELSPNQANLYETIRIANEAKVRKALASKGLAGSQISVLDALLKLRQVCCDPRLVALPSARKVKESAKIDWLLDRLPTMIEEGRRVLLFSQFTSMLALIEEALAGTGLRWAKLTGQSRNREAIVQKFTSGEVPLFLISIKAGGVGLNLPQADTVIHVDPWWNPAVENQATDRAHRMGQTSTVFVYKLVAMGTLEERIVTMQARKAALAQGLHGSAQGDAVRLTEAELDWLLQPIGAATESSATMIDCQAT